jgi:hypothetical protein
MEPAPIQEETPKPQPQQTGEGPGPKVLTVEISVELLQNMRNIIEVANARIHWKTEELLPIGLVIKQIDEHLTPFIKQTDSKS